MKEINETENLLPTAEAVSAELKRERYKLRYRRLLKSTLYGLVVVAAAAALIATLILPVLQISGTSMEPTIQAHRDQLGLATLDTLQRGQICLYRRPQGGYAIHRVHRITAKGVVLVGDHQVKTETVSKDQVLAQVVAIEREGFSTDTTTATFLNRGYRRNQKRLRQFHRKQLSYQMVNFPRQLLKRLIKKSER